MTTCPKCRSTNIEVKSVSMTGGFLARWLNYSMHGFRAHICKQCGFTEFYAEKIIGA